jgi:hypothetical protein
VINGFDGDDEKTCENCRFYALNYPKTGGECHRYAPRPRTTIDDDYWHAVDCYFPYMSGDDWCGEFEPHPLSSEQRAAQRKCHEDLIAKLERERERKQSPDTAP